MSEWNLTAWLMAKVSSTTIVMFTRLLAINIVASSFSGFLIRASAFDALPDSSSLSASISGCLRPKYDISLPDTNADRHRQMSAMHTMIIHEVQFWGSVKVMALVVCWQSAQILCAGKGSVSNFFIPLVISAKLLIFTHTTKNLVIFLLLNPIFNSIPILFAHLCNIPLFSSLIF